MPDYPYIERYYTDLAELIELGGSDNELSIRPAFQNCLAAYCAAHKEKLVLVPELASSKGNKPDGTIRDALRMACGEQGTHEKEQGSIQAYKDVVLVTQLVYSGAALLIRFLTSADKVADL